MSDRVVRCTSIKDLERKLNRDMKSLQKRFNKAIAKTANGAVKIIRENTPKAFGELRESIHATSDATIVSAPHAAAVEVGSRPHVVPIDDLIRWVKLRGMQGLTSRGYLKSKFASSARIGTTTEGHARSIARQIKSMRVKRATPVDAPEIIARKIQAAIAHGGTHPHWYVKSVLDDVVSLLNRNMYEVIEGKSVPAETVTSSANDNSVPAPANDNG